LTEVPDFEAIGPSVNVNIRTGDGVIEVEWDVVGCESFSVDQGKWARLRPGLAVPT
jgi:hypothetical protein